MKKSTEQYGFTLIEMLIVVAIIAVMTAIAVPNVVTMVRSQKMSSARNTIQSVLSQARAYAAQKQKYAGVRFQQAANGRQYLVLIEKSGYDPSGFQAVLNNKPAVLPAGIETISIEVDDPPFGTTPDQYLETIPISNLMHCLDGARTFSIIFTPTGRMKTMEVKVLPIQNHDIFGTGQTTQLDPNHGSFRLLSYDEGGGVPSPWCGAEDSTTGLYVYEQSALEEVLPGDRYSDFISLHKSNNSVEQILTNIYTGEIIDLEE